MAMNGSGWHCLLEILFEKISGGDFVMYFIADTHFSEENILRYENRPFKDIAEMDTELISRWNSIVNKDDDVVLVVQSKM